MECTLQMTLVHSVYLQMLQVFLFMCVCWGRGYISLKTQVHHHVWSIQWSFIACIYTTGNDWNKNDLAQFLSLFFLFFLSLDFLLCCFSLCTFCVELCEIYIWCNISNQFCILSTVILFSTLPKDEMSGNILTEIFQLHIELSRKI